MNTFYSYTPLYTPCIRDILVSSSHNHTFSSICVRSRLPYVRILCGCKRCIATWGVTCITTLTIILCQKTEICYLFKQNIKRTKLLHKETDLTEFGGILISYHQIKRIKRSSSVIISERVNIYGHLN